MVAAGGACDDRRVTVALRGRVTRRRQGRLAAGVCGGVAASLGVETGVVRFAAVLLGLAGGAGIALYALLWAVLPESDEPAPPVPPGGAVDGAAVVMVAAGVTLVLRSTGLWFSDVAVLPALVVAGGMAVAGGGRDRSGAAWPVRLAIGLSLVVVGAVTTAAVTGNVRDIGQSAAGAAVVLAGVGLMAWPWLQRLNEDLSTERRKRIRGEERAAMAEHLHDGVLQTLALIQRRADDPRETRALARRQERELRAWLFEEPSETDAALTVAALLQRELAVVEDDHRVRIEVVTAGDAPVDDAARALVAAGREAVVNAAAHSGATEIDVFLERGASGLALFVRDRGCGFDPDQVAADRRGLAESVRGRVERLGGTAVVRSAPGEGTEVELRVPCAPVTS